MDRNDLGATYFTYQMSVNNNKLKLFNFFSMEC